MIRRILKVFLWGGAAVLASYFILVVARIPHAYEKQKTDAAVAKIHATKLTLDDVMGKNLPPDPGPDADKTIAGIDANQNGIRDDVELAIFKQYPASAKTRAVLLQYALALQMEVIQPIVNSDTVGAIANEQDRAFFCVTKIVPGQGTEYKTITAIEKYNKSINAKQLNTEARKIAHKKFYENLKSGTTGESNCDIDLSSLPN